MLLVDTKIFAGAITEIPLDGNTLVTGTNAAGKTSIIQLMPLFYGQSPTKISNKTQGKDFYRHYLPHSTSYVAFEYRHRDGGRRSVIIYAASNEDKPMFRFVRSPLYEDMFINDDGAFIESKSLVQHLRKRGYEVADRIIDTLSDYQTVIQGLPAQKDKQADVRFLAQMVATYSATQPRQPLLNMDRVVFAMLKKDVSLQALEEMIAEKILQSETEIQVDGDRKKLEDWPGRYQAYLDVMAEEESTRALSHDCIELQGHQASAAEAISDLLGLRASAERDKTVATTLREKAESTLTVERDDYDEAKAAAHETTADTALAKRNLQATIERIEKKETSFRSDGIEAVVARASRKTDIEADLGENRGRIEALTGTQEKLTRSYDNLKAEAHTHTEEQCRFARDGLENRRQEISQQKDLIVARHAGENEDLRTRHADPIAQAELVLTEMISALGAAKEAARNPQIPSELVERRDLAQRRVSDEKDRINGSLRAERGLMTDEIQSRKKYDEIETTISRIEAHKASQVEKKHALEASKKPATGTLLAYLRQKRPDWGNDIGRVINPALLHRTDLHPQELPGNTGVFGTDIDVSGLVPLAEADLSGIDAEIDTLIADIADTEESIAAQHKTRAEASARLSKARTALHTHQANHRVLEGKKASFEAELSSIDAQISRAKEMAAAETAARLSDAELAVETAKAARDAARQAEIEDLGRLKTCHAEELRAIDGSLQAEIDSCRAREADLRARRDARISMLNAELQEALAKEGIDPQEIATLQSRAAVLQKDLENIRASADLVEAWKHFLKVDHARLPQLRTELVGATQAHAAADRAEQALKEKWTARQEHLESILRQHKTEEQSAVVQIEKIDKRLQGVDVSGIVASTTPLRGIDSNIQALNTADVAARKLISSIKSGVSRIATVFAGKPGSPAEQHLSQWRKNTNQTVEGPNWVPVLIDWYDTLHRQHLETLMSDARLLVSSISAAYQRLVALHARIGLENRSLQASLDKNNVIRVVQDISVTIASAINQLEFMGPMEQITEMHEKWQASGKVLPPDGFTNAMENLLTFWHAGKGISANLRDQIRIEGYIVENGNRRNFHARTDLSDISSNGVSYLVLTTILVGFINMVRGKQPVHVVWALDELGNIDAANTRALLDMLRTNNITLIAATPSASASVNSLFDYRIRVVEGPRLADIRDAGRPSQRLVWSARQPSMPDRNLAPNPDKQISDNEMREAGVDSTIATSAMPNTDPATQDLGSTSPKSDVLSKSETVSEPVPYDPEEDVSPADPTIERDF